MTTPVIEIIAIVAVLLLYGIGAYLDLRPRR
jgi:hypothetical protein